MWIAIDESGEYVINDHNGVEQGRLPTGGGISTSDVRDVMRERAATLKSQIRQNSDNKPVPIGDIMEWMTIIEDMAGNQIQLPSNDIDR